MEQLVRLIVEIGSDLDLDVTLRRIVSAAMELTDAKYGALGIRGADGSVIFSVRAGIDTDTARRLGDLAVGAGLRLGDVQASPLAAHLHGHDPLMRALLCLPITVRDNDFGTLYLMDDRPEQAFFSPIQEAAVRSLATAAAAAIDNARLFERARESAKWMTASREITAALLSGDPQTRPLELIVNRALELADAEQAILLVPAERDAIGDDADASSWRRRRAGTPRR